MDKTDSQPPDAPKRKRRSAAEAQREILDAAAARLVNEGPEGLRLQAIAKDVGISHSAILHHFGSREGLLEALRRDGFAKLAEDLRERLQRPIQSEDDAIEFFERVTESLGDHGLARLFVWQVLSGHTPDRASVGRVVLGPDGSGGLLDGLARALNGLQSRYAKQHGLVPPSLDESRRLMAMAACTLIGDATAGHVMTRSARLGEDEAARSEFRRWFTRRLAALAFARLPPRTSPSS